MVVDERNKNALKGLREISSYMGRSRKTVKKLIEAYGLPAIELEGAWISDKQLLDEWLRNYISGVPSKPCQDLS